MYVFHTASLGGYKFTADEIVLSDTLIHYWTNFARYGNPNGDFGSVSVDGGDIGFKPQVSTHVRGRKPVHTHMYTRTHMHAETECGLTCACINSFYLNFYSETRLATIHVAVQGIHAL